MMKTPQRQPKLISTCHLLTVCVILFGLAFHASPAGAQDMQVSAFLAENCVLFDHYSVTGDDRGAIGLSSTGIFYTGDNDTGLFPLDLSSGVGVGFIYDGLVSDLEAGVVYSLAQGAVPLQNFTSGTTLIDTLLEVDAATGSLTGASIALSSTIEMEAYSSAFFAGYGRIALWDYRSPGAIYDIALPSGTVTVLTGYQLAWPTYPTTCEMGAFWGVVESVGGSLFLDFAAYDYQLGGDLIARLDVATGEISAAAIFTDLGTVCALTVDPIADRWYFHYEGSSQFGSGSETTAYCPAPVATTGSTDLMASSAGPDLEVEVGQNLMIPVQVSNAGPDDATDVALSVVLPGSLELMTATPSQGTCSSLCGDTVVCDFGTVNAGSAVTVALQVGGVIEGFAQVSFNAYGQQIDNNLDNNRGGRNVTVTTTANRQVLTLESRDGLGQVDLESWTPDFSAFFGSVPVSLPGEGIYAGNGLAADPATGELYAILSVDSQNLRRVLATIDPRSGMATSIGEPGDRFSALAINDVGALFGLTGQGAATPETLYELNRATAAPTLVGGLVNGSNGEALAFNNADLLLYHLGGPDYFESVGVPGPVRTPISMCRPLRGSSIYAATHVGENHLYVASSDGIERLDTDGTHQQMRRNWPGIKGLELVEPAQADLAVFLTDDVDPVNVGDTFTYTVVLFNAGPDSIEDLGFIDTLPGQVVGVSANSSQGSCSINCEQVFCEFGTLASLGSVSVSIDVQAVMAGVVTNSAGYSAFGDPDPSNNQATETTTITDLASPGEASFELYSLNSYSAAIERISPTTFETLESIPITLAGSDVNRGNGLAKHSRTGVFWALLSLTGQSGRELVTVDPATGAASSVGNTGDYFAGLAFDDNGVLYGLTGNGGSNPRQLFTLDQTNGTPTPFLDISVDLNSHQGASIAFHPEDGMLYVTTGDRMLAVDPSGPSWAPVGLCRPFATTARAATSWDATNLLMVNDYSQLFRLDVGTGIGTPVGYLDDGSKGLVWTESLVIFADGFESGSTFAWSQTTP